MSRLIETHAEPDDRPLAVVRLYLVAAKVGIYAFVGAAASLLAAAFSHLGIFTTAALAAIAISTACNALIGACRAYSLWRYGAWRGLLGQRLSREQHPVRFFTWLSIHLLTCVILAIVATYLGTVFVQRL